MNKNLTDITVIVDRSGSMETTRVEAEGGLNTFIQKQRELPGDVRFSLVQFDNEYDVIHENVSIRDVPAYMLEPRGMTALHDAIGRTVKRVGERLARTPEDDRPGTVIVMVVTDGLNNASHEFTGPQVKELVTRQREVYNWTFIFLGANMDAIAVGESYGFSRGTTMSYDSLNAVRAYNTSARLIGSVVAATPGTPEEIAFTDEEREEAMEANNT